MIIYIFYLPVHISTNLKCDGVNCVPCLQHSGSVVICDCHLLALANKTRGKGALEATLGVDAIGDGEGGDGQAVSYLPLVARMDTKTGDFLIFIFYFDQPNFAIFWFQI